MSLTTCSGTASSVTYEAEAENITSENIIAGILEGLPVP